MEAIPILLFIAPSWAVAILYYWLSMRPHLNSPEMAMLNQNLGKVGLYWSNCEGTFRDWQEDAVTQDIEKAKRHFWVMTTILSFFSIIGTLLLVAIFMSGHPRLERNTFATALTKDAGLTPEQVTAIVNEVKSFV